MQSSSTTSNRAAGSDGRSGESATVASRKRALQAIVRRVLRTNSRRTQLEKMVQQEAGRLAASGPGAMSRDAIVGLVVDRLQRQLPVRANGASAAAESARLAGLFTIAAGGSSRGNRRAAPR